ncbi:hypothetical protein BDZ89DRAFT_1087269, partial [Hymenopellis radicata]
MFSLSCPCLHPVILLAFCHGIHTCIFFLALYYITHRKRMTLAGIITFLWFANTVILGLDGNMSTISSLPMGHHLILVWRCWVLYDGNLKVIAIPAFVACMVIVTYVEDISFATASQTNWMLVYYSMTVATNSCAPSSSSFAFLKTYRGIIEILVESAAMYAIIYIALLIAYAYHHDCQPYLGIAPTLIIARVMAGQSRPNDSWSRPSLPHMRSDVLSSTDTQTTSASTGHATADIDLEAQVQEIVEEPPGRGGVCAGAVL